MVLNLQHDYKVLDGLEDITLEGAAVTDAYRSDIVDVEAAPSDGVYLQTEVEWQIRTTAGVTPRIGQVIVSAGGTFVIQSVRQPFLNDYYGCACREVKIESDLALSNKVTRYPAVVTLDRGGDRVVSNVLPDAGFTDVPAKIQDVSAEHAELMGQRGFAHVYHIYLDSEIDLSHSDVLKDEHFNVYDVVSWHNRQRIDELSVVVAGTFD